MITSGLADPSWCPTAGALAGFGPKAWPVQGLGAGKDVPGKEPSLDQQCLVPCAWDHHLPIQAGTPTAKPSPAHVKQGRPSGLQELWKVTWSPRLQLGRFPPPSSFFTVAPPLEDSTLSRVVLQGLGSAPGKKGKGGRGNKTQPPGISLFFFLALGLVGS